MKTNGLYRNAIEEILPYVSVEGKSFLVTGATGLIGSCVVDLLLLANEKLGKNNHVYALGRYRDKLEKRFKDYLESAFFHIVEQDICMPLDKNLDVDFIIHGASNADPVAYAMNPVETMKINLLGGINMLEYCRSHENCKMVMLSTFEVYGKLNQETFREQDAGVIDFNTLRSCYPESKRAMEVLSRCYVEEYGLNVNVARLCSIYGPTMTQTDSKAHAQFLRRAKAHEDIVLKSKGEQRRTYCHVIDTVAGILTILIKGEAGKSYNVSNDEEVVTIAEVAQTIAQIGGVNVIFGSPSEIEKKGFSKPQDIILDSSNLRQLGWFPKYDIQKGMKLTLESL